MPHTDRLAQLIAAAIESDGDRPSKERVGIVYAVMPVIENEKKRAVRTTLEAIEEVVDAKLTAEPSNDRASAFYEILGELRKHINATTSSEGGSGKTAHIVDYEADLSEPPECIDDCPGCTAHGDGQDEEADAASMTRVEYNAKTGDVMLRLPDITYLDTQVWSADIGLTDGRLHDLANAINAYRNKRTGQDRTAESATEELRQQIRRACASAEDRLFEELEPHEYQQHAEALLGVVAAATGVSGPVWVAVPRWEYEFMEQQRERAAKAEDSLSLASVLEIPRPGSGIPLQLRRSYGHADRWAICDREGKRWNREIGGWAAEVGGIADDKLRDSGRFTLTEALPLARRIAEAEATP